MKTSILIAALLAVAGADPASEDAALENERRASVALLAPAKAKQLEVFVGQRPEKAMLHAEPLLRWSNPTAGSVYGEVFVWSAEGRPAAVASIYRWYHPFKDSTVEVVSLSTVPVRAAEGDKTLWEAKSPGIEFRPVPSAPAPAEGSAGRLSQLRALARRFSAELADKRGGDEVSRQLRLLNQPVHRYGGGESRVQDGALFTLVEVTDPEVWVLLETGKQEGRLIWKYAVARMNSDPVVVRLDDQVVARYEKIYQPWKYPEAIYTTIGFKPESVKVEESPAKP